MTIMTRALAVSLALAASRVLASDSNQTGGLEVRTSFAWGVASSHPVPQSGMYRVVRSEKDWRALLQELGVDQSVGTTVSVDFANWMLLYVAVPSTAAGSHLSIEYVYNFGAHVEVEAVEIRPTGQDCTTIGENAAASLFALIPRKDVPVSFSVQAADLDCRTHRGASVR